MSLLNAVKRPLFRPAIPLGSPFDIPTGQWCIGKRGENLMNGGLGPLTGIGARANNFKTALSICMLLLSRRSCLRSESLTYDTEGTLPFHQRFNNQASNIRKLQDIDFWDDDQSALTDISQYTGDEFCTLLRDMVSVRSKGANAKKYMEPTPFIDPRTKEVLEAFYPVFAFIDSLTNLPLSSVDAMYAKNDIGASGNNTDAASAGKAKKQWMNQLPQLLAKNGLYMILTSLIGDKMMEDKYAPDTRRLATMEKGTVFLGVSPAYYSLPNNLYEIRKNQHMLQDKRSVYPKEGDLDLEGDTDLRVLTVLNLRPKSGIAAIPTRIIVSQSEGPLIELSTFHMCREADWFGITTSGNNANYRMDLWPSVSMTRKSIRTKIAEDPILCTAINLTNDLLMLRQYHRELWIKYGCTAQELHDDLEALGYDWAVLLNTRNYWVFPSDEGLHPEPYLSILDLLKMRKKEYVPYWMSKEDKLKLKL